MKKSIFEVKFLSDIVLPASSNTEGNIEYLDFIPGSNFLGIAASIKYDYDNSFEIFHSGKVRFGDATPIINNQPTYKMPLSYFHEKLDNTTIYNHHHINDFSKFNQLKQMRDGYITEDKQPYFIEYNYTQKSAYDKNEGRSKEGSMYGYKAIKKNTTWQFTLSYDESIKNIEEIKKSLIGKKRLGKSKSSQYGQIEINIKDDQNHTDNKIKHATNTVVLYANSRLVLFNKQGNPSLNLVNLHHQLTDKNIEHKLCQIRTSSFTPYNTKRETKDYERMVINKGSVIVLKNISDNQLQDIQNGIGAYLSEGFGDLLINPIFLQDSSFENRKKEQKNRKKDKRKKFTQISKNRTIAYLMNKHNNEIDTLDIADSVQKFINEHKNLYPEKMNSQWGSIRSLTTRCDKNDIKQEIEKYISSGIAKEKWSGDKKSKLLEAIKKSDHKIEFVKLLSMQMPKVQKGTSS